MSVLAQAPANLRRWTKWYCLVWVIALVVWRIGDLLPAWLLAIPFLPSAGFGVAWLLWLRKRPETTGKEWTIAGTLLYPFWWQLSVFLAELVGLHELRQGFTTTGMFGLFLIGLGWLVWWVERGSRRIEQARLDELLSHGPLLISPSSAAGELDRKKRRRGWNPLDPNAWYYGSGSRKLKQSMLALMTYTLGFWLTVTLISQVGGCRQIYEMPAGGGQQKTIAQTVKIQKVVRKKYVVNPYSSIKFSVPPIDEIKLQLQEVTAHQYVVGYGEGTGAGFAGGTQRGKVRLIRLDYDGGDWNLNFGIGGDNNMLMEYGLLTQQKVADKSEAIRISQLASFPKDKSPPLVFLTGQGSISVSNNDIKVLREYLIDKHGLLFASAGSAHFHNQFIALMNRVLPEVRPVPVPLDDSIHRVPFAIPSIPYVVPHGGKEPLGWSTDGRWLVYYHPGDISDAWADGHSGVSSDIYNGCYQLGANVINYGHVEYSKWLQLRGKNK
ncbi:MAG: DUF4159 domain-containing protein [Planctomycetota bacterium]